MDCLFLISAYTVMRYFSIASSVNVGDSGRHKEKTKLAEATSETHAEDESAVRSEQLEPLPWLPFTSLPENKVESSTRKKGLVFNMRPIWFEFAIPNEAAFTAVQVQLCVSTGACQVSPR